MLTHCAADLVAALSEIILSIMNFHVHYVEKEVNVRGNQCSILAVIAIASMSMIVSHTEIRILPRAKKQMHA